MGSSTDRHANCVSNMAPMAIRSLGQLVHDERVYSAKPLIDHICAMCGQLLHPNTRMYMPKEIGKAGPPCQERGKPLSPDNWEVMPPHLLLFSKKTFASRLPSVYVYTEDGKLRLRNGAMAAPWLHFVHKNHVGAESGRQFCRENGAWVMDHRKPWWYCQICHNYRLPTSECAEAERVPMRNYWEGYFTRWHTDLGYPHLYPGLRDLYSYHTTLPTPDAALTWQKQYKEYVELLREGYAEDAAATACRRGKKERQIQDLKR